MHTELAFDDADLNGFVDGRIEPSRASALAESLASDPEAGARIDAWRRQNDSLRTMFASVLFEPVPVRLLPVVMPQREAGGDRARDGERRGGRLAGIVATTSIGMALIGFALGALASVGTAGFGLLPIPARSFGDSASASSDARDLASRAAEAHRTYLTDPSRPVEIVAGEEPRLARWLAHRLGVGVRIPNLSHQGWTFLDGRILPGRHGPAAFLAYGNGADRLGLVVSREGGPGEGGAIPGGGEAPTLGVATWVDGEFGYALTSDRGREWLGRNLAPLRDGVRAQARAGDESAAQP